MDIFEQLENLNVSEECFDEIMDIVETLIGNFTVPASDEFGKSYLKGKYSEEATPKEKRKALASDELLRRNVTKEDPKVKKSIKRHKKSLGESLNVELARLIEEILIEGRQEGESLQDYKQRLGKEQFKVQDKKYLDTLTKLGHAEFHDTRKKKSEEEKKAVSTLSDKAFRHLKNAQKAFSAGYGVEPQTENELQNRFSDDRRSMESEVRKDKNK